MRNVFIKLIFFLIFILLFIGFKSYEKYLYTTNYLDINNLPDINILSKEKDYNNQIENLSFYLDNTKYDISKDQNTYTEISDSGINKQIDFHIIHNIIKNICYEDEYLDTYDYLDLMKYSKINDELDLIKYYMDNKDKKITILNFIYQIKTAYLSNKFIEKLEITNFKYLNGLPGIVNIEDSKIDVILFNNNNMYKISFNNYQEEEIIKLLETFKFD